VNTSELSVFRHLSALFVGVWLLFLLHKTGDVPTDKEGSETLFLFCPIHSFIGSKTVFRVPKNESQNGTLIPSSNQHISSTTYKTLGLHLPTTFTYSLRLGAPSPAAISQTVGKTRPRSQQQTFYLDEINAPLPPLSCFQATSCRLPFTQI
jgi:hypothetical protein